MVVVGGGFPVDINNANVSYKAIFYFRVVLQTTIYPSGEMVQSLLANIACVHVL